MWRSPALSARSPWIPRPRAGWLRPIWSRRPPPCLSRAGCGFASGGSRCSWRRSPASPWRRSCARSRRASRPWSPRARPKAHRPASSCRSPRRCCWICYVNVPICGLALLGVRGALGAAPKGASEASSRIDFVGIALLVLTVTSFELLLQNGAVLRTRLGWEWLVAASVTIAGGVLLLRHFERAPQPVVDIRLFHDRNFAGAVLINIVVGAIFFATITLVPSLIQGPLGYDSMMAGMLMAPRGIATMAAMLAAGRLVRTADPRPFVLLGLVVTMAALAMFAATGPGSGLAWLVAASLILGVGAGCLITPLSVLTFLTIAPESRTDAAGLYNLARQLGGALGVAGVTAVVAGLVPARAASG